jgi:putative MATE family efflux protein
MEKTIKTKNPNDFTTGNILAKMVRFMVPILGALVLQAMYGAVDILIVGRFGTTAGVSGVSTGSNVLNLITFTITSLAVGVTVLIGRYLGEGKEKQIGRVIGGAICLFFVISVVVAAGMLLFTRPLVELMQAPAEAVELTMQYVRICGGGIVFIVAYNLISGIFRGLGNSKLPLVFVAIACVVNIFGDLLLVAVFKMDTAGAAIATVAAQAVSVVLSLLIIRKQDLPFHISRKDICFNSEVLRFVRIGMPIALQELLTQFSFLALCAFINAMGLQASSGYGVSNKIVNFVMLVPSALMQSMSSFVAQNAGAGNEKRARQALVTGMGIGVTAGVCMLLLSLFGGSALASLFTTDAGVVEAAAAYLRGFCPEAVVTCILFSFIGYYNGHGQTLFVMLQGIAQTFLVRLPMSYWMSIQPDANLTKIGWAAPSATVFGIVLNLIYYAYFTKKLRENEKK